MTENDADRPAGGKSWYARLRRILGDGPASRQDLLELLRESRLRTDLTVDELAMLQGVLEVSQTQVRDIMVPRSQMVILERDASVEDMLQTIIECGHSRFPVIGEDRDEVVGILLAKDLLRLYVTGDQRRFNLGEFLRTATYIPESKRLDTLLKEFRSSRNHMAIVVDEYGGTAGLLTIEDVLEEIVGDIDDEHDPEQDKPIQKTGEGVYHVRALTRIDEFNDYFGVAFDDEDYDTIGGLIMHELGRLPRKGETLEFGGFDFRIMQADRRRIHNVEVTGAAETSDAPA